MPVTIHGAIVLQAAFYDVAMEHFPPREELQLNYGNMPFDPFMFQGDLFNRMEGLGQVRETNVRVNKLMKERGLALTNDKYVFMIIGSKRLKQVIQKEV